MKIVLQRVLKAKVVVDNVTVGSIKQGYLLFIGISDIDTEEDLDYLISKIIKLRIFNDEHGKMNLDILQVEGEILAVSQFTLFANISKGNRPSFVEAGHPEKAKLFYELFTSRMSAALGKKIEKGIFGADMKVSLVNDGPVTIILDSIGRK